MTIMADRSDTDAEIQERAVMDPEPLRSRQLAAALVLRALIERTDLPVVSWSMEKRVGGTAAPAAATVALTGYASRSAVMWSGDEEGCINVPDHQEARREAVRRWAAAFSAPIEVTPMSNNDTVNVSATFSYADVTVEIWTNVTTWEPER